MKIYVCGYPHDVGGAGPHLWATVRLWRSIGIDVHLLCFGSPNSAWQERLNAIGAVTHQVSSIRDVQDIVGKTVLSFCSGSFLRKYARDFRKAGASIVWVGCMTWLFDDERRLYRDIGPFDRTIVNSRFQESRVRTELEKVWHYRPDQIVRIPSPFWNDEWDFQPRPRSSPFVIGRLSRHDADKYDQHLWRMYSSIRNQLGGNCQARVMAWRANTEKKCGKPPAWADALPQRTETAADFLHSLHAMVHRNGGAAENRSRVCLEAMASGVPVVAENAHGWPELIVDGETGFLCNDEAEFVERAVQLGLDEELRLRIARQAREALPALIDLDSIGKAWLTMFDELEEEAKPIEALPKCTVETMSGSRVIAGLMAVGPSQRGGLNPRWKHCLAELARHCDLVHVRVDGKSLSPKQQKEIVEELPTICGSIPVHAFVGRAPWTRWNWREELLRSLDDIKPDVVLFPDCDEEFPDDIVSEIDRMVAAGKPCVQYDYEMVADAKVPLYPSHCHMKAFIWRKGMSYQGYRGFAAVTDYASSANHHHAKSKIKHYCFETAELRAARGI